MSEAPPVEEKNECVKVVVRMRPFNQKEKDEQEQRGCSVDTKTGSVSVLRSHLISFQLFNPSILYFNYMVLFVSSLY
jgi:hypothetical protein